jgi:hypothetical protein
MLRSLPSNFPTKILWAFLIQPWLIMCNMLLFAFGIYQNGELQLIGCTWLLYQYIHRLCLTPRHGVSSPTSTGNKIKSRKYDVVTEVCRVSPDIKLHKGQYVTYAITIGPGATSDFSALASEWIKHTCKPAHTNTKTHPECMINSLTSSKVHN